MANGRRQPAGSAFHQPAGVGRLPIKLVVLSSTDADYQARFGHQGTTEKQSVLVLRTAVVALPYSKTQTVELQRRFFGALRRSTQLGFGVKLNHSLTRGKLHQSS